MPYLPYEEPGITTVLSLTSFLLLLNASRYILDRLLYCGIIGEILIGIIWGLPVGGTAWLTEDTQETILAYGYLGLIGLVFEGGLSTDLALLKKAAYLSISVATIGLLMPIALSFILLVLPFPSSGGSLYPSPLAAFSAGASLCSTSLGTTFAILSSANMQQTRIGVVLVGAAMMDDVVGLVMVNIVTTLGHGGSGGWPIARPIAASFGLLLVTMAISPYILRPVWSAITKYLRPESELAQDAIRKSPLQIRLGRLVHSIPHLSFILTTAVLIIFVTIASFIDASVLFAAFIAGGLVNFLWNVDTETSADSDSSEVYEKYFKSVMHYVLVPFFFASIGFSIPITNMFSGSIVWKGIVYAILMTFAKGLVGIVIYFEHFTQWWRTKKPLNKKKNQSDNRPQSQPAPVLPQDNPEAQTLPDTPHVIAMLVGLAMISRGEIGFLIASLSQSSGTLTLEAMGGTGTQSSGEEIFLVIVWAVVICTIVGPIGVGILIRRLRQPQHEGRFRNWM